jgi:hypothetical protein
VTVFSPTTAEFFMLCEHCMSSDPRAQVAINHSSGDIRDNHILPSFRITDCHCRHSHQGLPQQPQSDVAIAALPSPKLQPLKHLHHLCQRHLLRHSPPPPTPVPSPSPPSMSTHPLSIQDKQRNSCASWNCSETVRGRLT